MNFDWLKDDEWCACEVLTNRISCKCGYKDEDSAREFVNWWESSDFTVLVPVKQNVPEFVKKRQLASHFNKRIDVDFK